MDELAPEDMWMRVWTRRSGTGPPELGGMTDGGGRTSTWSSWAWGSLDTPLHTQQQVVLEERGQWEAGGSLSATATQLSTHSQPGQVLQPSWLVHHAQGRAVEGFVLLGQEWNRVRWPNTLPSGGDLVVGP